MSNLTSVDLANQLNFVSTQLNRYLSIFIFIFDTISNLLNCFVLSRPSLRKNPCVFLFLMSSIANLISISFGLSSRILSSWNLDLTERTGWMCKTRVFVMFTSRTVGFWLISYATVDRWLSSSVNYQRRRLSSLKNSQRGSIILSVLSICLYVQVFPCYEANFQSGPLRCFGKTARCRLLIDLSYAFLSIIFPLLIMFIFGLMTISNLSQTHQSISSHKILIERSDSGQIQIRCIPEQRSTHRRWRKLDRSLHQVLFIQILFLAVLTLPQIIEKFYITLTMNRSKSILQVAIDHFIYHFALLLTYVASGMSFYIYTLAGGNVFRQALIDLFFRR